MCGWIEDFMFCMLKSCCVVGLMRLDCMEIVCNREVVCI